jgi:hypothetical protein
MSKNQCAPHQSPYTKEPKRSIGSYHRRVGGNQKKKKENTNGRVERMGRRKEGK